jgi:uncharacterized circularly permuted ATP-grasp superfamily protein
VVLGGRATRDELSRLRAAIDADPSVWIAQEPVVLSTHPTVIDGRLEPRHVDLRPFVIDGRLLPGGISRYAQGAGELVVTARRAVAARASRSYRDSRKSALSLASCEGVLRLSVAR